MFLKEVTSPSRKRKVPKRIEEAFEAATVPDLKEAADVPKEDPQRRMEPKGTDGL